MYEVVALYGISNWDSETMDKLDTFQCRLSQGRSPLISGSSSRQACVAVPRCDERILSWTFDVMFRT